MIMSDNHVQEAFELLVCKTRDVYGSTNAFVLCIESCDATEIAILLFQSTCSCLAISHKPTFSKFTSRVSLAFKLFCSFLLTQHDGSDTAGQQVPLLAYLHFCTTRPHNCLELFAGTASTCPTMASFCTEMCKPFCNVTIVCLAMLSPAVQCSAQLFSTCCKLGVHCRNALQLSRAQLQALR